jgi:PrtD family type I secretion system ABC transporter
MLGTGAYLVIDQNATPGVMMASTIILGRALAPLEGLLGNWKSLVDARSAYHRLSTLIDNLPDDRGVTELPPPVGKISTEKIFFHPKGSEKPIIKDISFELAAGESVGIIGPSASGKSTLARLLVGVWEPSTGTVRIDGADVSIWPREQLGKYIGYLPQDVELFPGTVSENIARLTDFSSPDVIAAAQKAGAHEMILKLPQGYDTKLGEGGSMLSGGQRQRIGLARALFGNPKLVILDEPNSNLDADGEAALLQAIRHMKADNATLVMITHKPSLLADIDKILLLREGVIELYGPRDAVLARLIPQLAQQQKG